MSQGHSHEPTERPTKQDRPTMLTICFVAFYLFCIACNHFPGIDPDVGLDVLWPNEGYKASYRRLGGSRGAGGQAEELCC